MIRLLAAVAAAFFMSGVQAQECKTMEQSIARVESLGWTVLTQRIVPYVENVQELYFSVEGRVYRVTVVGGCALELQALGPALQDARA